MLSPTLKVEADCSPELLVFTYTSARRYNPEDAIDRKLNYGQDFDIVGLYRC